MNGYDIRADGVHAPTMTVIYSGQHYVLSADSITVSCPGEAPRLVDPESLPLPVARALQAWRASAARA